MSATALPAPIVGPTRMSARTEPIGHRSLGSTGAPFVSFRSSPTPTRWVGTKTSSATRVLLAVPCMPATCQVSLIVTWSIGMVAMPGAMTSPAASSTNTPPPAQFPWKPPDAKPHEPLTTKPPSTGAAVPVGASTPNTRGRDDPPQISSCALPSARPDAQVATLSRLCTHAVDGHAAPSSAATASWVAMVAPRPPSRLGKISSKSPASSRAAMLSGWTCLVASVTSAFAASSGCSAVARATRSVSIPAVGLRVAMVTLIPPLSLRSDWSGS